MRRLFLYSLNTSAHKKSYARKTFSVSIHNNIRAKNVKLRRKKFRRSFMIIAWVNWYLI